MRNLGEESNSENIIRILKFKTKNIILQEKDKISEIKKEILKEKIGKIRKTDEYMRKL